MTPEERNRQVAELMRKYGIKLDEGITKHVYQIPPVLSENVDWGSPQGSYSANVWVSPLTVGNHFTASPVSLEKSYEQHLRELMQEMEFHARYEKSGHEKFVQYEPKDREWAEYFGFIKKKRYLREIRMNSYMLRQITDATRAARSWLMRTEPNLLTSLNGIPIVVDEDRQTGCLTLVYDDGFRVVIKATAEMVAEAMKGRGVKRG